MKATIAKTIDRTIRQTKCDWEANGQTPGEIETKQIRVLYFSPTVAELKAERDAASATFEKDTDSIIWVTDSLIKQIHSLPDVVDSITLEWLEGQDLKNLHAIRESISEDIRPKAQPGK